MTFWVTLDKPVKYRGAMRRSFSADGASAAEAIINTARELLACGVKTEDAKIVDAKPLPYPGEPRLGYKSGDCPSFCMHPVKCAGQTRCPRPIPCVD